MRMTFVNGEFNISRVIYTNNNVSIANTATNNLKIYPNPAKSKIYIKNQIEPLQYKIIDLPGKTMKQGSIKPNNHLSIKELNPGPYFLVLYNNQGAQTYRIIKQK